MSTSADDLVVVSGTAVHDIRSSSDPTPVRRLALGHNTNEANAASIAEQVNDSSTPGKCTDPALKHVRHKSAPALIKSVFPILGNATYHAGSHHNRRSSSGELYVVGKCFNCQRPLSSVWGTPTADGLRSGFVTCSNCKVRILSFQFAGRKPSMTLEIMAPPLKDATGRFPQTLICDNRLQPFRTIFEGGSVYDEPQGVENDSSDAMDKIETPKTPGVPTSESPSPRTTRADGPTSAKERTIAGGKISSQMPAESDTAEQTPQAVASSASNGENGHVRLRYVANWFGRTFGRRGTLRMRARRLPLRRRSTRDQSRIIRDKANATQVQDSMEASAGHDISTIDMARAGPRTTKPDENPRQGPLALHMEGSSDQTAARNISWAASADHQPSETEQASPVQGNCACSRNCHCMKPSSLSTERGTLGQHTPSDVASTPRALSTGQADMMAIGGHLWIQARRHDSMRDASRSASRGRLIRRLSHRLTGQSQTSIIGTLEGGLSASPTGSMNLHDGGTSPLLRQNQEGANTHTCFCGNLVVARAAAGQSNGERGRGSPLRINTASTSDDGMEKQVGSEKVN